MPDSSAWPDAEGVRARGLPFFRNGYNALLTALTATLCLSFPVASYAVFGAGADRVSTAGALSVVYVVSMTGLFVAPWLPLPSLRGETTYRRLERMVIIWILVHTLTAIAWEIPWMLFHEQIAGARDELWAYTWWAYIDGGDTRYLEPDWMVFFIEGWADINGILGLVALGFFLSSGKKNPLPVYYFMFAAPLHIYPTLLYYVSEIAEGMPNVDTTSFVNLVVKFVLANCFWVILPFFVLIWGKQALERIYRERFSSDPSS
jgi:hypothetical protein